MEQYETPVDSLKRPRKDVYNNVAPMDYDKLNSGNRRNEREPRSINNTQYDALNGTQTNNLELGVRNLGYNQGDRPESRVSRTLEYDNPSIDPPKVSTNPRPSPRPSPPVKVKGASIENIKKPAYTEYSSISDVMAPYVLPSGNTPHYDFIDANGKNRMKPNAIYEPSNEKYKLESSSKHRKEKKSAYCQCALVLFIGLVAIAALVLILLLMFGVLSINQCKDCGDNAISISDLQTDLKTQQNLISGLQATIERQNILIDSLNTTVLNLRPLQGERGPRGYNGSEGLRGPSGPSFDISKCTMRNIQSTGRDTVKSWEESPTSNTNHVNYACGFELATSVKIEVMNGRHYCHCEGPTETEIKCFLYYWVCPVATWCTGISIHYHVEYVTCALSSHASCHQMISMSMPLLALCWTFSKNAEVQRK